MKKLYICFVDLAKVSDIIPWTVLEWAMRNNRDAICFG